MLLTELEYFSKPLENAAKIRTLAEISQRIDFIYCDLLDSWKMNNIVINWQHSFFFFKLPEPPGKPLAQLEVPEEGGMCVPMVDSCGCVAEAITVL